MPLPTGYETLLFRGHFRVTAGVDFSGSLLTANFGGGFEEAEAIFPRIHTCSLNYPEPFGLHRDAMIEVSEGVFKSRLDYIWDFYCDSKDGGNEPFLMKNPRDGKWYLWKFEDDDLSVELINAYLATTGLKVRQVYVRGVTPDNADGSFEEEVEGS